MSIQNSIDFLQAYAGQPEIRSQLYKLDTRKEFTDWLSERNLLFQYGEFDESVNLLHVKCQTIEQADDLLHKVDWFRMFWSSLTET